VSVQYRGKTTFCQKVFTYGHIVVRPLTTANGWQLALPNRFAIRFLPNTATADAKWRVKTFQAKHRLHLDFLTSAI
jgi:hypothetical protein